MSNPSYLSKAKKMTKHPLLDKLEKLEKEAEMGEWLAKTRFIYESLNNHKKLIEVIRLLEEMGMFYATKSEPDYAGANPDGSPKCVMQAPWDSGRTAFKALLKVKELLG